MTYFAFFLSFLLAPTLLTHQFVYISTYMPKEDESIRKTIILDTEKSHIEIHGKTNINSFKCEYKMETMPNQFDIETLKYPTHLNIKNGTLKLKVTEFSCENSQMTKDFRELLEFKKHPFIYIDVNEISQTTSKNFIAETLIQLSGQQQKYNMELATNPSQEWVHCEGEQEICITDFGLDAPEKFLGMVRVNENITIRFQLYLKIL
ncbi:hypothetical protein JKA74_10805 [Marivirga sp. S37H4]|uniref:Lipid/polyisoprenoid-binding YceI-like domain-containing protein n=1 Tax=Marivirga aurantiaca TaxID=2802615 RepID=A0A935C9D6_9BACT|nr:YceI family protein [Marivirga aurantiaca]MBK6265527.1 hypothetical protein [Marivirga aurantiaca]